VEGNLFTCDVAKGNIPPGGEQKLTFTFNQPAPDPLLTQLAMLQGIGQWTEAKVELRVTGGFVPAGTADAQVYEVVLRAYVHQI